MVAERPLGSGLFISSSLEMTAARKASSADGEGSYLPAPALPGRPVTARAEIFGYEFGRKGERHHPNNPAEHPPESRPLAALDAPISGRAAESLFACHAVALAKAGYHKTSLSGCQPFSSS